jgi:hypothetical protein
MLIALRSLIHEQSLLPIQLGDLLCTVLPLSASTAIDTSTYSSGLYDMHLNP